MAGKDRPEDQNGIDAQFEAIISGMDMPVPDDAATGSEEPAPGGAGEKGGTQPGGVQVALLLPGLDNVEAIAAVCRLGGVQATCLPSSIGAIVVLAEPSYAASREAARAFSSMLRAVPVVLLRRGPSEDPADSDVQASRWLAGVMQELLAPGLILAQAPDIIEGLILGDTQAQSVAGALDASQISKLKATRILARLLRGQAGTADGEGRDGDGA